MFKKFLVGILITLLMQFVPNASVLACTDFRISTTDGAVIVGRTMEWGEPLNSRLALHPRGAKKASSAPDGKEGVNWVSKYGFVSVDANGLDVSVDGMNERGLCFDMLWLPQYTKYQDVPTDRDGTALCVTELGDWILGSFQDVDEVTAGLANVLVWAPNIPSFGGIPTAHFQVHDSSGKSVVVEFIDGRQQIRDNAIGVMTNAPPIDWQLINLRNFLSLTPNNAKTINVLGTVLAPPGEGSGLMGIPGDWTPPSRFVRTAAMLNFSGKTRDAEEAVNLAEHIANAVDIPRGDIRSSTNHMDYTQWFVIKDLTNKNLYFRSYKNMTLRKISFDKLDFRVGQQVSRSPIDGGEAVVDVSGILFKNK